MAKRECTPATPAARWVNADDARNYGDDDAAHHEPRYP